MLFNGALEKSTLSLSSVRLRSLKLIMAMSWSIVEANAVINDVLPQPGGP